MAFFFVTGTVYLIQQLFAKVKDNMGPGPTLTHKMLNINSKGRINIVENKCR
jgi:hypothetical protein